MENQRYKISDDSGNSIIALKEDDRFVSVGEMAQHVAIDILEDYRDIKNGIKKVIMQNNKNVVEEYYDGPNRVMTCNYAVEQHLFKKNSSFKCTFEDPYTQKHATYYFLKLAMMHNFVTDKTEKYINDIAPAERKTLSQH